MAFTEGGNKGSFNGATEVTLVSAPGAGRRLVKNITICNLDTATVTVTAKIKDGATYKTLFSVNLLTGEHLIYDEVLVLPAATVSLVGILAGAPAATNPDFSVSYGDAT